MFSSSSPAFLGGTKKAEKEEEEKAHTGSWCAADPKYTKHTLKALVDAPVASLLKSKDLKGERKFEASDVITKDGSFYAICDSSWAILKIDESLPLLSSLNSHLGEPSSLDGGDPSQESGFEAIFEDHTNGQMYVVREAVDVSDKAEQDDDKTPPMEGGLAAVTDHPAYHAIILKVNLNPPPPEPSLYAPAAVVPTEEDFTVEDECPSQIEFDGDSKGFEGAIAVRGADGDLYMLGLCEGNNCKEGKKGKDKGHGKVVVMKRVQSADFPGDAVPGYDCFWQTVVVLDLPREAHFQDYSAIALNQRTKTVAITSQENSQVWVGTLTTGADGEFDPAAASFEKDGTVYDFPRNSECKVQYCNVEGIHWVDTGDEGDEAPQVLVAVSDKMKGHGKQPFECLDKDQSFHLFAIP